jgi:hypothetical protein
MQQIMLDLETLSTRPDAAILSIGACFFDIKTGKIGDTFHRHIQIDDAPERGHISADTVLWWLSQTEDARKAITQPTEADTLKAALYDFIKFVPRSPSITLWSNGATFDLVIIRQAIERCKQFTPWQYWQERDTRTIVDIANQITGINTSKTTNFTGTKHDALADAIFQAQYVSAAYALLAGGQS